MISQVNLQLQLSGSDKMSKNKYFWVDVFFNICDFVVIAIVIYLLRKQDIYWWIIMISITPIIGQYFVRNYLGVNIYAPKLSKRHRK